MKTEPTSSLIPDVPSPDDDRRTTEPLSRVSTSGSWPRRLVGGVAKLGKFLLVALVLLAGAGAIYEAVAGVVAARRYPPPGELYDVGGYRLHLHCVGKGSPTVVLEAGLGRDSLDWSWVQPGLAAHTRTCAYDRAGAGWSDPGSKPRDSHSVASELHALLIAAGVDPPLVLVGHSAGGSYVQLFEHLYPEWVTGMVLVDVTHREVSLQKPPPAALVAVAKGLRFVGVARLFGLIDGDDLPPEAQAMENTLVYRPAFLSTMVAENEGVAATARQIREVEVAGSLGDLPLVILTAAGPVEDQPRPASMTLAEARQDQALRHRLQREMLHLSNNSRQVMAEQSGHQIQKDQPELVIEAVRELVDRLR